MNRQQWELMNRALEHEANPEEWQAFIAHLDDTPGDARLWNRMQDVDRILCRAPAVAPAAGFSTRVMARVHLEAERRQQANGFALAVRMTALALVGLIVILGLTAVLIAVIGSIDLQATLDQIGALVSGIGRLLDLLATWAEKYPMLPAIGLASIPLAFATLWLAVYYTPKDRLRTLVQRRLPL